MRSLIKATLLLTLYFICNSVFAGGVSLQPSSNDQSMFYLGSIFGNVGNVIVGQQSSGQVMGMLFANFNRAVLIIGTLIFTYVYGKGILDTAAHGEFLGKQQNSLWVPLRSVAGIALMIPKAGTGYCVIQVFLMWVVVNGIGAADVIWSTLVSSWSNSQTASTNSGVVVKAASASSLITPTQTLFGNLVCAYSLQHARGGDFSKDFSEPSTGNYQIAINYHGSDGTKVSCGNVNWAVGSTCSPSDNACKVKALAGQRQALNSLIDNLSPIAQLYVDDSYRNCVKHAEASPGSPGAAACTLPGFPSSLTASEYPQQKVVAQDIYNSTGVMQRNFIEDAVLSYVDNATANQVAPDTPQNTGNNAIDEGWIYAGSYFFKLAKTTAASGTVPSFMSTKASDVSDYLPYNNLSIDYAAKYSNSYPSNPADPGPSAKTKAKGDTKGMLALFGTYSAIASTVGIAGAVVAGMSGQPALAVISGMMAAISVTFGTVISLIINNNTEGNGPVSTLLYLQILGHVILLLVGIAFVALLVAVFSTGLATNMMDCMQPIGYAIAEASSYVSIMILAALGSLLAVGGLLAVYLPLLPFIYFLFGVLSWFVAVIESMVAAPIVALGIIHPEGHDFWGKAEPAVMLMLNVFLRPSLMLFGLVAGLFLSYVYVQVLTVGFSYAELSQSPSSGAMLVNPVEAFIVMGLYVFLIIIGYTQCFKLINELPNRVLQWIGFQGQLGLPSDDATGQARQGNTTMVGSAQGGFSKTSDMVRDNARQKKEQGAGDSAKVSGNSTGDAGNSGQSSSAHQGNEPTQQGASASRGRGEG